MERFQELKKLMEQTRISQIMAEQREKYFSFETFNADSSNFLAYASCLSIAEKQDFSTGLLYVYGDRKTGKTHLLKAIRNHIGENSLSRKVKYLNADEFTAEIIWELRNEGNTVALKERYLAMDVFLLDDLQYLCDKARVLGELYDVIRLLLMNNKQIVITATCAPEQLEGLNDEMVTLLKSGENIEIQING